MNKEVSCSHCRSVKIVKNGIKRNGKQTLLCNQCRHQFQWEYVYNGAVPSLKAVLKRMLLRGSGIRDCAVVLHISTGVVLRTIITEGFWVEIKPKHKHYHKVQIDEQWSYV